MKKVLLCSGIIFAFFISASAQSYLFYRGEQPLEDNAEFTVSNYQVYLEEDEYIILSLESDLYLKNVTDRNVQATVTQTILEEPSDSENGYLSFCLYDCTTGNSNRTKTGELLANSFNEGFHVNFYAFEGKFNRIKVKYEVYATNDIAKSDKKTVTVTYVYDENSIVQINRPIVMPSIHVIQEGNQVKFNYNFDSDACRLEIYKLTGQKIAQHRLLSGNNAFILPEQLAKGVYVYVIRNEKQAIITQKFIVK